MPTILITGTNRGLGLEFTRQYAADGWRVLACCRKPDQAEQLHALAAARPSDIRIFPLDVADFSAIDDLADQLRGEPIDLLLNNAGAMGPKPGEQKADGQSFGTIDYDIWQDIIRVNTFAPVKMAEAFVTHVAAGAQKKIVSISSVLGSIAETYGNFYAYRTSKAALNMAMASLSKDLAARGIMVAVFCPGWVKTDMGGPQAEIMAEVSISGLRRQIAQLTLEAAGRFLRYNEDVLSW